ncbi:hypothetical protein BJ742DRAFT_772398 [Cladochytrium replicatum]|nr:hypothetical protein BJ742DRAFT_772398 [Cladochytrium replicatum]
MPHDPHAFYCLLCGCPADGSASFAYPDTKAENRVALSKSMQSNDEFLKKVLVLLDGGRFSEVGRLKWNFHQGWWVVADGCTYGVQPQKRRPLQNDLDGQGFMIHGVCKTLMEVELRMRNITWADVYYFLTQPDCSFFALHLEFPRINGVNYGEIIRNQWQYYVFNRGEEWLVSRPDVVPPIRSYRPASSGSSLTISTNLPPLTPTPSMMMSAATPPALPYSHQLPPPPQPLQVVSSQQNLRGGSTPGSAVNFLATLARRNGAVPNGSPTPSPQVSQYPPPQPPPPAQHQQPHHGPSSIGALTRFLSAFSMEDLRRPLMSHGQNQQSGHSTASSTSSQQRLQQQLPPLHIPHHHGMVPFAPTLKGQQSHPNLLQSTGYHVGPPSAPAGSGNYLTGKLSQSHWSSGPPSAGSIASVNSSAATLIALPQPELRSHSSNPTLMRHAQAQQRQQSSPRVFYSHHLSSSSGTPPTSTFSSSGPSSAGSANGIGIPISYGGYTIQGGQMFHYSFGIYSPTLASPYPLPLARPPVTLISLPTHIVEQIVCYLDARSILVLEATCQFFQTTLRNHLMGTVWKHLCWKEGWVLDDEDDATPTNGSSTSKNGAAGGSAGGNGSPKGGMVGYVDTSNGNGYSTWKRPKSGSVGSLSGGGRLGVGGGGGVMRLDWRRWYLDCDKSANMRNRRRIVKAMRMVADWVKMDVGVKAALRKVQIVQARKMSAKTVGSEGRSV